MSELKPCPFCGTTVVSIEIYGLYRWVECGNASCLASVKPRSFLVDAGNANHIVATDWNTRPIEDALRAENERLRKALGGLLHIIEEHGTPIQKAHATKLLEAREALEVKG